MPPENQPSKINNSSVLSQRMNNQHNGRSHLTDQSSRRLKVALVIVLAILVAEVIGGLLSNSLALLGDAGHMLVDALALGISLFAIAIARRPATATKTYGYHRAEIMAALANGAILVLLAICIFYEAYQRFLSPPAVQTTIMMSIAAVGLVANLTGILLLRGVRQVSLNIRAAFWHIFGDTISSLGVIVGGAIIAVTGWGIVDPIIAVLIGGIILWGAVRLVRESIDILLEAVPKHVQMDKVIEMIRRVPGVEDVHDIHIWTITSDIYALSTHLLVEDQMVSRAGEIVEAINKGLAQDFNIHHTTLQLECEKCASCPSGFICEMSRRDDQR